MPPRVSLATIILASLFSLSLTNLALADAALEKGKTVYNGVGACAVCHGAEGKGDGPAGGSLNPKPKNFSKGEFGLDTDKDGKTGTEIDVFNVITNGAAKYGGSPLMAGRSDISEDDRKALAKFVLSLKKN